MGRKLVMALAALGAGSTAHVDAAPEPAPSTPPTSATLKKTDTREFPGLPIGTFVALPQVILSATRDDNIYAQRTDETEDTVFTLSPSLVLQSDWERHELSVDVGADLDRYQDANSEDVEDFWLGLDGTRELTEHARVFGGLRHTRDHEDRYVPGAAGPELQREPTRYEHDEAYLGVASEIGRLRLRGGGTYDRYDYYSAQTLAGARIDNGDRKHDLSSLGLRAGYALTPNHEPFIQYATDRRRYANNINGTTFNRDSDGYRAALGLRVSYPQQRFVGEVFAGTLQQRFDYSTFSDIHKPYFGALASWRPTPTTRVTGYIDRSLEETTVSDDGVYAAASLDTTYGLEIERALTSRLSVLGHANYTDSEYQSYDRRDKIIDAGAGLRYYVSSTVYVGGDMRVIDRNSDDLDGEYSRSQVTFSVGYTPGRSKTYQLPAQALQRSTGDLLLAALPLDGLFAGPYAGAALSHGPLTSTTSGPREDGGSDVSQFGASGLGEALFLGYGWQLDRWYAGIEAEVEQSRAHWSLSKDKADARTTSLDKDDGYGLSLRGGYVVNNGSLLYLRVGRVRTRFDSYYTINDQAAATRAQDDRQDGSRLGVGADLPAGDRLFLRMEYAYTDYDAYDVDYVDGEGRATERFANEEGQFRLGVGWRFAAETSPVSLQPSVQGFYIGAHAGHGSLDSHLDGYHSEDGAPPLSQAYTGDFSGMGGIYGVFVGYGHSFDRWYVGLEAEVDTGRTEWSHSRETSGEGGRDFSVEKKSDYGLALRLGYSLPNGTLLYGRVGPVRARFNTTWAKGGNADANIDRSYDADGMRYGVGAEVPLTQQAFARLDYTRTDYDSYGFRTGHGNPDEMNFDNRESLFRMGLGFRF
ncbi:hypothetical protein CXK93_18370 [Stutzerimonas decontaminans]|uniref:Outer membrane protein beta-barrel domain-containing protein n=2 Tax=Stutzerimonas TaxID=2901164 RepID=A0ABX4VWK6_9GAMM|nr:outer membrane beta-barrel protein [Stutzerimonas decontaminans]MCQ4244569.1 outer membrane beta-barrel protein [Stutzerimonas decontaminans]PNF83525.1 hypothetical protein CXK93_18370 [Stutzerimonas decontaminans]